MDEEQLLKSTSKRTRRNANTIKYGMFCLSLVERNYYRLHEYCITHNLYKSTLVKSLIVDYLDREEIKKKDKESI